MIHKTKGIVLRCVKYGETSVIVSIFTELFGLQSYLVNGVRTHTKKGPGKANLFQPGAVLDLVVYHNELKNIQRLKEFRWAILYQHIFFNIFKNAVALFMIELLQKCLKQPEGHPELYHFTEDALLQLDVADEASIGNYPLFYALHVASFFGLRMDDNYSADRSFLDLKEGFFVPERPHHTDFLQEPLSFYTSQLLKAMHPSELPEIRLNQEKRRLLLQAYQDFFALHIQGFGVMKTVPVLKTVLEDA